MTAGGKPEVWTTRRLLAWMNGAFAAKGIDSPRLCSELLLAHVIGCDRLRLYMDADRPASPLERENLRNLVSRALEHEPIQYLVGESWFYGLPMHVDKRVLIPRPATETMVEHLLHHVRAAPAFDDRGRGLLIADVCTGSGCIAVALARNLPEARIVATDICEDALAVAAKNAKRHGVADRIDLLRGDLLEPLLDHPATRGKGSIHYLVANPPYVPDDEWNDPAKVGRNVKGHEPDHALRGGPDGLDHIRRIIADGPVRIAPDGLLLIEIPDSRAEQVRDVLHDHPDLSDETILDDHEGLPRIAVARRR